MSLTYKRREHDLLNTELLTLLGKCNLKKKLGKKVTRHKVPVKIKNYQYWLIFTQPAKVLDVNYEKQEVDIKMKTTLMAIDAHFPENEGTSTVRYKLTYEAFGKVLLLTGATIVEMSFGTHLLAS